MHAIKFCRPISAAIALLVLNVSSRAVEYPTNTAPSTTEAAAQNRAEASLDFIRILESVNVKPPPPLPPTADDPNRPANTHPAGTNSPNWRDDVQGHNYMRSIWGTWSNYDPSKANKYPMPDALTLKNGQPVKDADTWTKQRRPEIVEDFISQVYGRKPEFLPTVTWTVTNKEIVLLNQTNGDPSIIALRKQVIGKADNRPYKKVSVNLDLTIYTPSRASGPVPTILIATGSKRYNVPAAMHFILDHGWGCAVFNTDSVQPDNAAGFSEGIIGLAAKGTDRKADDWGVLAAWSWGLSRCMDYLGTDDSVDGSQVGIAGLSRWGKEALYTMVFDPRFAVVYCSCSGEGGAKLHRRDFGETVDNICSPSEYHWMALNFLKYATNWSALPVDANELIALCAPRPVFITGGTQDYWADPEGEFMACVGAGPVYQLLGKKDLGTTTMPAPDEELISGDIGFREHNGGHSDLPDWPTFLKFADKYMKAR